MNKIVFIDYTSSRSSYELYLISNCPKKLEGDWLNPPPDMDTCERYLQNAVKLVEENGRYKYANRLKVVREPDRVVVISIGTQTGARKEICGYKLSKSLIMK